MQSSGAEGLRERMQDLSESNNLFAYLEQHLYFCTITGSLRDPRLAADFQMPNTLIL